MFEAVWDMVAASSSAVVGVTRDVITFLVENSVYLYQLVAESHFGLLIAYFVQHLNFWWLVQDVWDTFWLYWPSQQIQDVHDWFVDVPYLGPVFYFLFDIQIKSIVIGVLLSIYLYNFFRPQRAIPAKPGETPPPLRTRKRDRLRKVMTNTIKAVIAPVAPSSSGDQPRDRKRDKFFRVAKTVLGTIGAIRRESAKSAIRKRTMSIVPASYFTGNDLQHPEEQSMILRKNLRILSHFDEDIMYQLMGRTEVVKLTAGQVLFRIGDVDDSFYVVQEGKIRLYAVSVASLTKPNIPLSKEDDLPDSDGQEILISELGPGEHLSSLLSIIDVLSGGSSKYKTLRACAGDGDCILLQLRASAFKAVIEENPRAMRQFINVITLRLQRVTLLTLYKFFGLTSELTKRDADVMQLPPASYAEPLKHSCSPDDLNMVKLGAVEDIKGLLCLEVDTEAMMLEVRLEQLTKGSLIVSQGQEKKDLVFVVRGKLHCFLPSHDNPKEQNFLYTLYPRDFCGEMSVLSGSSSFVTVTAPMDTTIVRIPSTFMDQYMNDQPALVGRLSQILLRRIAPLVRQIDFALEWLHVESGQNVYLQGEAANAAYIVLSGRLRSVHTNADGTKEILSEHGRPDIIGEVEVMTEALRPSSLLAIRDTELTKVPAGLFQIVRKAYPQVLVHLMRTLGKRMTYSELSCPIPIPKAVVGYSNQMKVTNLATIALVPLSDAIPIASFASALALCLGKLANVTHLNKAKVYELIGFDPESIVNEYRLISWLGQLEDVHDIILFEAESELTPWSLRCIRQADCVILVGKGDTDSALTPLEAELQEKAIAARAQKELVILYDPWVKSPVNTTEWLNKREWCSTHHNMRFDETNTKGEVDHEPSSLNRLARHLLNKSVGLVLGGGGARGIAHIGIIKALEEHGIPIDMVGGTSIGSFVAGLYAEEMGVSNTNLIGRAQTFAKNMLNYFVQALDLTYPFVAMFTGKAFNGVIHSTFHEKVIEDLWIPYFCVTTDVSESKMRIHTSGSLWHYVRGSMTLVGYLPPICDPIDGNLLVDGGYGNVLPIDVMKEMGANTIISVDVASKESRDFDNYGEAISGWWCLVAKWVPFVRKPKVPDVGDISSRLTFLRSNLQYQEFQGKFQFEYVRPPIERYGTLQWGKFEEILKVGYDHMGPIIEEWQTQKKLGLMKRYHRGRVLSVMNPGETTLSEIHGMKPLGEPLSPSIAQIIP